MNSHAQKKVAGEGLVSIPSFPSLLPSAGAWERPLIPAKFYFALTCSRRRQAVDDATTDAVTGSAMKLPQQARSQMKFGNEGCIFPAVS